MTDTGSDDPKFTITPEFDGLLILLNRSDAHLVDAYLAGLAASCALAIQQTLDTGSSCSSMATSRRRARWAPRAHAGRCRCPPLLRRRRGGAQRERGDVGPTAAAAHRQGRGGLSGAHALRDAGSHRRGALWPRGARRAVRGAQPAGGRHPGSGGQRPRRVVGVSDLFVSGKGIGGRRLRAFRLRLPGAAPGRATRRSPTASSRRPTASCGWRCSRRAPPSSIATGVVWRRRHAGRFLRLPRALRPLTSNAHCALARLHPHSYRDAAPTLCRRAVRRGLARSPSGTLSRTSLRITALRAVGQKRVMDAYGDGERVRGSRRRDRRAVARRRKPVDAGTLCAHVSQLCGLSPQRLSIGGTPTHPAANVRGDVLCSLLGCSLS